MCVASLHRICKDDQHHQNRQCRRAVLSYPRFIYGISNPLVEFCGSRQGTHTTVPNFDALARVASNYATRLGASDQRLVSNTNNIVVRARRADGQPITIKVMVDSDIDTDAWEKVRPILCRDVRVPETILVDRSRSQAPYDIVVTEFIEGEDLASVSVNRGLTAILPEFASASEHLLTACEKAPIDAPGFGPFKRGRDLHSSPEAYYTASVRRFSEKVENHGLSEPWLNWHRIRSRLVDRFEGGLARKGGTALVPVDVNLKNFLALPDGGVAVLNLPIIARGARAHGEAAILLQGRIAGCRPQLEQLLFKERRPLAQRADHAAFEVLYIVGILAFYASDGSAAMRSAVGWGGVARLTVLLQAAIEEAGL